MQIQTKYWTSYLTAELWIHTQGRLTKYFMCRITKGRSSTSLRIFSSRIMQFNSIWIKLIYYWEITLQFNWVANFKEAYTCFRYLLIVRLQRYVHTHVKICLLRFGYVKNNMMLEGSFIDPPIRPSPSMFCLLSAVLLYISGAFYVINKTSSSLSWRILSAALEECHSATEIIL